MQGEQSRAESLGNYPTADAWEAPQIQHYLAAHYCVPVTFRDGVVRSRSDYINYCFRNSPEDELNTCS